VPHLRWPLLLVASLALHAAAFAAIEPRRAAPAHDAAPFIAVDLDVPMSGTFQPAAVGSVGPTAAVAHAADARGDAHARGDRAARGRERGLSAPARVAANASAPTPSRSSAPTAGAPTPLFGAVGVAYATDLATTFTRAFPQVGSADAAWTTVPFGGAGAADVTLTLDAAGHLASSAVDGDPPSALRRDLERTLAVLGPRTFTAREAATRLRVTARVSPDDVHDGLHGDVFALSGGSFSGDTGAAFFALPAAGGAAGRRVDVRVRLVR